MESCYHPVLEIQWSCENPPTDFLKAFVILQILLRKFYSDNRIFPFQTTCFIFLPLALSFFDKVGSLFFKISLPFFCTYRFPVLLPIPLYFTVRYATFACLAHLERITIYPAHSSVGCRYYMSVVLVLNRFFIMAAFRLQRFCPLAIFGTAFITPIPCPMA
jgi:hypothetical protein